VDTRSGERTTVRTPQGFTASQELIAPQELVAAEFAETTAEIAQAEGPTARERRHRPLVVVHTGQMKGKSTAAFGMALRGWNQGWSIGVFQFVKSGKWRPGEESAFRALDEVYRRTGTGGPVQWHVLGDGWSWSRAAGPRGDRAAAARRGWEEIRRRLESGCHDLYVLDEFTYPLREGWVDVEEVVEVLRARPGRQHVVITGREAPDRLVDAADLVVEMTKIKHPLDAGQRGQRGIEW
jgi:cob(I)alamin adenosyltransferase